MSFLCLPPTSSLSRKLIDATSKSLATGHATTSTPIGCLAAGMAVVGHEKYARIPAQRLERHPRRREQVGSDRHKAARRGFGRATREPTEDLSLHLVQWFVGHPLFELTLHDADVHSQLIRSVCPGVRAEITHRGWLG